MVGSKCIFIIPGHVSLGIFFVDLELFDSIAPKFC